jgi:hypothetical protein
MEENKMSYLQPVASAFSQYAPIIPTTDTSIAVFPRSNKIVLNRHSENAWKKALESKFNELTALRVGWDGYNGQPVSFTCASFAAKLLERLYDDVLPLPSLVPGSDGTLQFEWHINQYDLEVDVIGAFNVIATRHDCLTGETEELELDSDYTALAGWISDLRQDREPQQVTAVA